MTLAKILLHTIFWGFIRDTQNHIKTPMYGDLKNIKGSSEKNTSPRTNPRMATSLSISYQATATGRISAAMKAGKGFTTLSGFTDNPVSNPSIPRNLKAGTRKRYSLVNP